MSGLSGLVFLSEPATLLGRPTPTATPTVTPTPSTSAGPDLPSTGGYGVVPLAASGAGLLAAGAVLVLLSRRSRQH